MLLLGILGFQPILLFLLLLFPVVLSFWVHHKWRNMVARKEEIRRLVDMVSRESAMVEFEATHEYYTLSRGHQCAMCFRPTTIRCSKCKSVHYCSGKCQVIHWRQGHKDECQPSTTSVYMEQGRELNEKSASGKQFETCGVGSESLVHASASGKLCSSGNGTLERSSESIALDVLSTRTGSKEVQEVEIPAPMSTKLANCVDGVSHASKLNKTKINNIGEGFDCKPQLPNAKMAMYADNKAAKAGYKKSNRRAASSEMLVTEASTSRSSLLSSHSRLDSVANNEEDDSLPSKNKEGKSLAFNDSRGHQVDSCRKSMWRKVQQLKGSKQTHSYKIIFSFELFMKLYSCNDEFYPFGLINCGNSCYANAVLQCLAFTRPLTSYLLRGLHSNTCQETRWCFICELEFLIIKAKRGNSLISPIRILSNIQKIGSHLGHGREEDAHEFLRYAVDTMQHVCLKEAEAQGPSAEETTLVALMFGGYLRSKITCMKCFAKSERFERIMDLTVEIDGDIGTLDKALMQFTADEVLDGENKYKCSRCKSHVKAKKNLKIAEAPNIITIVLKRFQVFL
uniref:Uncharacterized protein MANES_12G127400 n=1 Tax=Rhizophora mucronata TaxID=61149 RepID=A0A2P2JK11_RHIMU